MCISSSTDDVIGPSRTIVCVDVIVFCKEERRGCWSVEAFGEEVSVYVRSLMMRVPSRPSNGDDGAKEQKYLLGPKMFPCSSDQAGAIVLPMLMVVVVHPSCGTCSYCISTRCITNC